MKSGRRALAALGVTAALALPVTAAAHHTASHTHGHGHANGHGSSHPVMYIFKGTYAGGGVVNVAHGNAFVRKGGFIGQAVAFDLASARLSVADTNGDTVVDESDVVVDDHVLVQARLPKRDPGVAPYAARMLVDQTNPAVD